MWEQLWLGLKAPFVAQDWWTVLNSGIVTALIPALVGVFLAQRVNKVAQTAQAQQDAARATNDESAELDDEPPTAPAAAAAAPKEQIRRTFEAASFHIKDLKAFVDAKAHRVRDGRTRRKYENVARNDYRIIVGVIEKDGGWKGLDKQYQELMQVFEKWRPYARGRALVSQDFIEDLAKVAKRYNVTPNKPAYWHTNKPSKEEQG